MGGSGLALPMGVLVTLLAGGGLGGGVLLELGAMMLAEEDSERNGTSSASPIYMTRAMATAWL